MRERYVRHLDRLIELAGREIERNRDDEQRRGLAEFYHANFSQCRDRFFEWNGDLLGVFRRASAGRVASKSWPPPRRMDCCRYSSNLPRRCARRFSSAATLIAPPSAADPSGFWLPECAYTPGLENVMREANLRWFIIDAHGLMFGRPASAPRNLRSLLHAAGPAAFARDRDSSRQVWSAAEGYPGDPAYREFYRDIGFDLPPEYIRPGSGPASRKFTGIKYHRITSRAAARRSFTIRRSPPAPPKRTRRISSKCDARR